MYPNKKPIAYTRNSSQKLFIPQDNIQDIKSCVAYNGHKQQRYIQQPSQKLVIRNIDENISNTFLRMTGRA